MKSAPIVLRFVSGSATPASASRKSSARVDVDERDVVVAAEQRHDLLRLVLAHQPVVDEDAGELVADRLVDQHGGDRAVDAAREPADHAALPDLRADLRDLARAEMRHRPVAGKAGDLVHEVGDELRAVRRVDDLGVEHGRIDAARLVGGDGERRVLAHRLDREALGQPRDAVAVAHPDRIALADLPDAVEERALLLDLDVGAAELGGMSALDLAAELHRRRLLAVADREDRQALLEHRLRRARRALRGHRGRAAREDDGLRARAARSPPRRVLNGTISE